MRMARFPSLKALAAALLLQGAAAAMAQDLSLAVRHTTVSAGADGIKRTAEFSERFVRRGDSVWVERIVPAGWHGADEHAKGGKGHRHLDVAAAARWITREADGTPRLRLASAEDKVLVDVARTDYENVGFDGQWTSAYYLIDPAVLKRMKAGTTQGDTTTYTSSDAGRTLKIVWNQRLQYPVSVESASGPSSRKTVVELAPDAKAVPWSAAQGYQRKDYADYLD